MIGRRRLIRRIPVVGRWQSLTPGEKLQRLCSAYPLDAQAVVTVIDHVWERRMAELRAPTGHQHS